MVFSFSLKTLPNLARAFAALLQVGDFILLEGEMGAGKTTFVQAVCRALDIREAVTSPTFALVHQYQTQAFKIYHADLYRLTQPQEIFSTDLADQLDKPDGVWLIEWAERMGPYLPRDYVKLIFFHEKSLTKRQVRVEILGSSYRRYGALFQ